MPILLAGAGGACGAVMRYRMGLIPIPAAFPVGTMAVNFIGSLAIGVSSEAGVPGGGLSPRAVLFFKTGLCGGFTTFSAFSLETASLMEQGRSGQAALYAIGSVVLCLAGVMIGKAAVRFLRGAAA